MPDSPSSAPAARNRWLSFRLRTLLVVAPLLAIGLAWGFRVWYAQQVESRAIFEIERLGGKIVRDDRGGIVGVELPGREVTDKQLERLTPHLAVLPQLKTLVLVSNNITDSGLQHLARVPQLKTVYVADTKITPNGIAALQKRLPSLIIDRKPLAPKATGLAMRPIYPHATLSLALSPEGHLIGGAGNGQVRVWDPRSGEMLDVFQAHDDWTFAVAFHPNGTLLATGGGDNLIKLWEWPSLRLIGKLAGHDDDVHALRFTPDGRTLVSTGDDWTVRVWDLASRTERHILHGHEDTIPGLALSRDGKTAASASRDHTIRLWDIVSGESLAVLRGHDDDVMAVAFHPSGRQLASASYDRTVRVWNLQTGQSQALGTHDDWAFSLAWSSDGSTLVSTSGDGVRAFDSSRGGLLWHDAAQKNVSHVVWQGKQRIVTSSADSSVVVRNASGSTLATMWPLFTPGEQLAHVR